MGLALVMAFSAVTVALSLWWTDPLESFYVRIASRTLTLAAALLYCAWVFLSRWRQIGSRASLITGGVCLVYGATQSLYGAALVARIVGACRARAGRRSDNRVAAATLPARSRERLRDLHRTRAALRRGLPAIAAGPPGERQPPPAGRGREPRAASRDRRAPPSRAGAPAIRGEVRRGLSFEPVRDGDHALRRGPDRRRQRGAGSTVRLRTPGAHRQQLQRAWILGRSRGARERDRRARVRGGALPREKCGGAPRPAGW